MTIEIDLDADILEICIKFMHYKHINRRPQVLERPDFPVVPEKALDVLKAAIYL